MDMKEFLVALECGWREVNSFVMQQEGLLHRNIFVANTCFSKDGNKLLVTSINISDYQWYIGNFRRVLTTPSHSEIQIQGVYNLWKSWKMEIWNF